MNAAQFFDFQESRLLRKEIVCRRDICELEESQRNLLRDARAEVVLSLLRHDTLRATRAASSAAQFVKPDTARLHELANAEVIERDDQIAWETNARDALLRSRELVCVRWKLQRVLDDEARWRGIVSADERAACGPLVTIACALKLSALQNPMHEHSETATRLVLELVEARGRWRLAVWFGTLLVEWDEEWQRLTVALQQRLVMQYLRAVEPVARREVQEREALKLLGRPAIDEWLELAAEREERRQAEVKRLEILQSLRREELRRMAERIERPDDFILAERMKLVEDILGAQDVLLQDAAEYGLGDSYSRLRRDFLASHDWITDPAVPFREIEEYRGSLRSGQSVGHHPLHSKPRSEVVQRAKDLIALRTVLGDKERLSLCRPQPYTASPRPQRQVSPPVFDVMSSDPLEAAFARVMALTS